MELSIISPRQSEPGTQWLLGELAPAKLMDWDVSVGGHWR